MLLVPEPLAFTIHRAGRSCWTSLSDPLRLKRALRDVAKALMAPDSGSLCARVRTASIHVPLSPTPFSDSALSTTAHPTISPLSARARWRAPFVITDDRRRCDVAVFDVNVERPQLRGVEIGRRTSGTRPRSEMCGTGRTSVAALRRGDARARLGIGSRYGLG